MKTLHALLIFVWLATALGQMKSEYQPGTILAVVPRPSKTADETASYDISVRVANTVYVCLYTPPPGTGTPLYAAGREMLFKVGEKSMTFNDMLGNSVEVPIESKTPGAAVRPESLDVSSPSTPTKSTLVIGLTGVRENTTGNLQTEEGNLHFEHSKNVSVIPLSSIIDVVTGSDSQRLIHGPAGTVSQFGPYGSGRFLSLFRSKLDTLTVQYRDRDGGLHGAIFTMPSDKSEAVKAQLLAAGAHTMVPSASSLPETSKLGDEAKPHAMKYLYRIAAAPCLSSWLLLAGTFVCAQQNHDKPQAASIEVKMIQSDELILPAEFQIAMYEHLVQQLEKSGWFERIYRDGDRNVSGRDNVVVLYGVVRGLKQGSERKRQVTTVAGKTSITVHCRFTNSDGVSLLERNINGKVRFFGGNLKATYDFAKKTAGVARELSVPKNVARAESQDASGNLLAKTPVHR